jgi:autotransporter-associated beta strand protein
MFFRIARTTPALAALAILFAACCLGGAAQATTYCWDTTAGTMTGGNGNWSLTDSNWSVSTAGDASLSAWTASGTDSAEFYTGSGTATIVAGGVTANSVTFNALTAYTINGPAALSIAGGITAIASAAIDAPVILATGQSNETWSVAAGQTLNVGGAIVNTNSCALILAGPGSVNLTGPISFTGTIIDNGYYHEGVGGLIINAGTVNFSGSGSLSSFIINGRTSAGNAATFSQSGGDISVSSTAPGLQTSNYYPGGATTSVWNMTGGTFASLASNSHFNGNYNGGVTTYNWSGGYLKFGADSSVGVFNMCWGGGAGTMNIGGSANVILGWFGLAGTSTVNLSGGTLTATLIGERLSEWVPGWTSAISRFNFNGGVLQPRGNDDPSGDATFMQFVDNAVVQAGGAIINTNGYTDTIAASLVHDANLGANADGGLTKCGSGMLTLSGSNTYNGGTIVNGGILSAATTASLPCYASASSVYVASGAIVAVRLDGWAQGDIDALTTLVNLSAGACLGLDTSGGSATYSTAISRIGSSGAGGLAKVGANTLCLTGSNSYTGPTIVAGGTLQIGNVAALPSSGALYTTGGVLDLGGNAFTWTGTTISFAGGGVQNGSLVYAGTYACSYGAVSANLSGAAALTMTGPGLLCLAGTNTYAGGTVVSGGTLQVGTSLALGSTTGALAIDSGGVLDLFGCNPVVGNLSGSGTIVNSGPYPPSVLTFGSDNSAVTFSAALAAGNAIGFAKTGSGTLSFPAGSVYTFTYQSQVNGGTLNVSSGTIALTGGYDLMFGENAGNNAACFLSGSGRISSDYEEIGGYGVASFVQSGGADVATANTVASALVVGAWSTGSGTYALNAGLLSTGREMIGQFGAGSFIQSGGTNSVFATGNGYDVALYVGVYSTAASAGSYSLSGSGLLTVPAETVGYAGTGSFTQSAGTNSVSGDIQLGYLYFGNGAYSLGGGQLSAANEYVGVQGTGTVSQTGGTNTVFGTLCVGYDSGGTGTYNLNGGTLVAPLICVGSGSGSLTFNGGTFIASSFFSIPATAALSIAAGSNGATFDTNGYTVTIGPAIDGAGGLTKSGAGSLVLTGSNTYFGGTTVSGGTLVVADASALPSAGVLVVGRSGRVVLGNSAVSAQPLDAVNDGGTTISPMQQQQPTADKIFDYSTFYAIGASGAANYTALPGYDPLPNSCMCGLSGDMPPVATGALAATYSWQQSNGYSAFLMTNGEGGFTGPYQWWYVSDTLAWMHSQGYRADYVFADYEENTSQQDILAMVAAVRSFPDPNINQAKIGNYQYFPGRYDLSAFTTNIMDRTQANADFLSSGLNVAMPCAYFDTSSVTQADTSANNPWANGTWWNPTYDSSYLTPNQQAAIGSAYLSPNQRAALFYVALERPSLALRNLPAGDECIAYVSPLLTGVSTAYCVNAGQYPTEADYEANVMQLRLRGAAGIVTFPGDTGGPGDLDYTTYRTDVYNAWTSLDWFFGLPTSVVSSGGTITANGPLNLDTYKNCNGTYVDPNGLNGGIEWSAYQRGNRIVAVVSNLGNGDQATYWTLSSSINANLPSQSPVIPMGCHAVLQYLSNPTFDNFESANTRTLCGPNASYFQQAQSVVAGQGNTSSGALGLTASAPTGATSSMWFQAGNPGGLLSTDQMVYGGNMYFSGSGTVTSGATIASFEPVTIGSYELSNTASAVAAGDEGPKLSFVGSSGSTIEVEFRATSSSGDTYVAANLTPAVNSWYSFKVLVNPNSGTGAVFYKSLTSTNDWTQLIFYDLTTSQTATSIPLLLSGSATPTTFNGWQVSGVQYAQLDDLSMQLYPYLSTMGYTLFNPMESTGMSDPIDSPDAGLLSLIVAGGGAPSSVPEPSALALLAAAIVVAAAVGFKNKARYLWSCLVLAIAGCGGRSGEPKLMPVAGTVTLDGKSLSGVTISFVPEGETHGNGGGYTGNDGTYQLVAACGGKGVPVGEYRVVATKLVTPDGSDFRFGDKAGVVEGLARQILPIKYRNAQQSVLTATVRDGKNKIDFALSSAP